MLPSLMAWTIKKMLNNGSSVFVSLWKSFCRHDQMHAFVNSSYFCLACLKAYDHKDSHKCEGYCPNAELLLAMANLLMSQRDKSLWIKCDDCSRSFRTDTCFEKHKAATYATIYICRKFTFVHKSPVESSKGNLWQVSPLGDENFLSSTTRTGRRKRSTEQ